MFGFLTSRFGGWAVGGLGIIVMVVLWQSEKIRSLRLEKDIEVLQAEKGVLVANEARLDGLIATQQRTMDANAAIIVD